MHIHFVCTGNSYRSRLAEAYLKSKFVAKDILVTSSGIEAIKHRLNNGPICWYAMRILKRNDLVQYMSWSEQQSTKELAQTVDLLVCMKEEHLNFWQNELGYQGEFEVLNILDLHEIAEFIPADSTEEKTKVDNNHIALTEMTFKMLTEKIDELISKLK